MSRHVQKAWLKKELSADQLETLLAASDAKDRWVPRKLLTNFRKIIRPRIQAGDALWLFDSGDDVGVAIVRDDRIIAVVLLD